MNHNKDLENIFVCVHADKAYMCESWASTYINMGKQAQRCILCIYAPKVVASYAVGSPLWSADWSACSSTNLYETGVNVSD